MSVVANVEYATIWFVVAMLVFSLMVIAMQVLFALAAYNDAKARGNSDPVMWALLIGFLGLIPGIIYLCVRNNSRDRLMICPKCGIAHRVCEFNCPQCGIANPYSQQFNNPMAPQLSHRAKMQLIAAIIVLVVSIILLTVSIIAYVFYLIPLGDVHFNY